jgi:hypothetical protein
LLGNKRVTTALKHATAAHIEGRRHQSVGLEGEEAGSTDTSTFNALNNIANDIAGECRIMSEVITYIARNGESVPDKELLDLREAVMAMTERVRHVIYLIDDVCCEAIMGLHNIISKYTNYQLLYQVQRTSNVIATNL